MTLLATLRHGETHWSLARRIQGRIDIPLCDPGRARLSSRMLPDGWQGTRVLTSPLARCLETASLLGLVDAESDARLAEMRWGNWEGRRLEDLRAELGETMSDNEARGMDFTPPGGESPRQVFERVSGLLAEIAQTGKPTLAIAHRGVIRAIFATACGWDMRGRAPMKLDWDALHVFRLDQTGAPSVYCMNVGLPQKGVVATAT